MKLEFVLSVLLAGLLSVPPAAQAASQSSADNSSSRLYQKLSELVQPGRWKATITRKTSVIGTQMTLPAKTMTVKRCITQEDLKKAAKSHVSKNGMSCNVTQRELSGKTLHSVLKCTGRASNVTVDMTKTFSSATSSTLKVVTTGKVHGMPIKSVARGKAERVGTCTKASQAAQPANSEGPDKSKPPHS